MDPKTDEARVADESLEQVSGGSMAENWGIEWLAEIERSAMSVFYRTATVCPYCKRNVSQIFKNPSLQDIIAHMREDVESGTHQFDKKIGD